MTTKAFTKQKNSTCAIIIFILYLTLVAVLCFGNFNDETHSIGRWLPESIWGIPIDKYIHFLMFFPFPIAAFYAFRRSNDWKALVFAIIVAICFAFMFEFLQSTLTGNARTSDPWDFVSNMTAITTSSVIMAVKGIVSDRRNRS